jgi:hypothetical protein
MASPGSPVGIGVFSSTLMCRSGGFGVRISGVLTTMSLSILPSSTRTSSRLRPSGGRVTSTDRPFPEAKNTVYTPAGSVGARKTPRSFVFAYTVFDKQPHSRMTWMPATASPSSLVTFPEIAPGPAQARAGARRIGPAKIAVSQKVVSVVLFKAQSSLRGRGPLFARGPWAPRLTLHRPRFLPSHD